MSIVTKNPNVATHAQALAKWLQSCPACCHEDTLRRTGADFPFTVLQCRDCGQVVLELLQGTAAQEAALCEPRSNRARFASFSGNSQAPLA